jgi:protein gp37
MAPRAPTNLGSYTDFNLNFIYGCRRVSEGCRHCYIDRFWKYYDDRMRNEAGAISPFQGRYIEFNETNRLRELDKMPENSVVFVNGLSDTFGEFVNDEMRNRWLEYLAERPQYQFMLCTKRTGLMWLYFTKHKVPSNVWVGTTIENKWALFRLPLLKKIEAKTRWISFEPLLEDLGNVDLTGISFVCLGGETDPSQKYRPFNVQWGKSMLVNCRQSSTNFWYDGGNGLNDSRQEAPKKEHIPNSGILPQERYVFPKYGQLKLF